MRKGGGDAGSAADLFIEGLAKVGGSQAFAHQSRILDAAGIPSRLAGFNNRMARATLETNPVFAPRQTEDNRVLRIVARRTVKHENIARARFLNDGRVGDDQRLPRNRWIRDKDRVGPVTFEKG